MKKKWYKPAGITAVVFALVANVQYALVNYGLGSVTPGMEVIAQTSGAGTNGTTTDGTNWPVSRICTLEYCQYEKTVGIPPFQFVVVVSSTYTHCKESPSGRCSSAECDTPCDMTL